MSARARAFVSIIFCPPLWWYIICLEYCARRSMIDTFFSLSLSFYLLLAATASTISVWERARKSCAIWNTFLTTRNKNMKKKIERTAFAPWPHGHRHSAALNNDGERERQCEYVARNVSYAHTSHTSSFAYVWSAARNDCEVLVRAAVARAYRKAICAHVRVRLSRLPGIPSHGVTHTDTFKLHWKVNIILRFAACVLLLHRRRRCCCCDDDGTIHCVACIFCRKSTVPYLIYNVLFSWYLYNKYSFWSVRSGLKTAKYYIDELIGSECSMDRSVRASASPRTRCAQECHAIADGEKCRCSDRQRAISNSGLRSLCVYGAHKSAAIISKRYDAVFYIFIVFYAGYSQTARWRSVKIFSQSTKYSMLEMIVSAKSGPVQFHISYCA